MTAGSAVRVEDAGKLYRSGRWGIRHATFELAPGVMTALIGPNGAGKSTTLNLLGGLLRPTEGVAEVGSANGLVGWCPQTNLVDWSLSVRENVTLGARLAGLSRAEAAESTGAILELCGLADQAGREAETLSGGQLRRVQIARALVGEPAVLLLDEPAAGLDPEGTDLVFSYLRDCARRGALVLVSSHDLQALQQYADDVLLIEDGRVAAHEPVARFLARVVGHGRLRVTLSGPPDGRLLDRLRSVLPDAGAEGPVVTATLPAAESLPAAMEVLFAEATVVAFEQETIDLRDAYLSRHRP